MKTSNVYKGMEYRKIENGIQFHGKGCGTYTITRHKANKQHHIRVHVPKSKEFGIYKEIRLNRDIIDLVVNKLTKKWDVPADNITIHLDVSDRGTAWSYIFNLADLLSTASLGDRLVQNMYNNVPHDSYAIRLPGHATSTPDSLNKIYVDSSQPVIVGPRK